MMKTTLRIRLLGGLLALLGFGAVACNEGALPVAYGTSEGEFEFKAKVVDQAGAPLEGVQLVQVWGADASGRYAKPPFDSPKYLKTDGTGCAGWSEQTVGCDSLRLFLHDPAGRFADTVCRYKVHPSYCVERVKVGRKWGKVGKAVEIKVNTKR